MTVVPREALDDLQADITKFFNRINTANNYGASVIPSFYLIAEQRWFGANGLRGASISSIPGPDQPAHISEMLIANMIENLNMHEVEE